MTHYFVLLYYGPRTSYSHVVIAKLSAEEVFRELQNTNAGLSDNDFESDSKLYDDYVATFPTDLEQDFSIVITDDYNQYSYQ